MGGKHIRINSWWEDKELSRLTYAVRTLKDVGASKDLRLFA
jgi:hypothetical protein